MKRAVAAAVLAVLAVAMARAQADKAPPEKRGDQRAVEIGEAIGRKYPEQVALVTSVGSNGTPNIITVGWTMFCSGNPPMLAIAIGKTRHSHALIMESREFVFAMPGADLEKEMLLCGTKSGRDTDKFKETGLTARPGLHVKAPLIEECLANLECKVEHAYDSGSHTIFVGRIVGGWVTDREPARKRLFNLGRRQFQGLP